MIHTDSAIFEVQILSGQTAELTDSHAGFQKHHKLIVIFVVGVVSLDKVHPDSQMFFREGNSRHGIIYHHIRQFEDKRILSDCILITRHLKCGFNNTSHTADSAEPSAILLELCEPLLGIGYLDGADFAIAEIFFLDQIQNKLIADLCVVSYTFLQADVLLQQFNYRNLSCFIVNAIVNLPLNFLFFLTKFLQSRCVNGLSLSSEISVPVLIDPILSLAFSCLQNTPLIVFSFFAQFRSPFVQKESRCDIHIVSHQDGFFYDESADIRWKTPAR